MIAIDFVEAQFQVDTPEFIIVADELNEVLPALREVEAAWKNGYYAVGYLSYEAAPALDPQLVVHRNPKMPLLWFAIFREPSIKSASHQVNDFYVSSWNPDCSSEEYQQAIHTIHQAIERGDTYQVNHTIRLHASFHGDAFAYFKQLSALQQGYNAFLDIGRYQLLSISPELFFHWKQGHIQTRPMKGTAKRGRYLEEDRQNAIFLGNSEKDRAENLMIVDLLRNDLGKIAIPGTVRVPSLFTVEKYSTVWQMTSTVEATTRPEITLTDVFQALFPCGSITGAPKRKTMELITSLEHSPREVYCGTIGYLKPNGEANFNVAIRTAIIDQVEKTVEYGVGGGITWDSTSRAEYEEVLTKARILSTQQISFQLLESIRLDNGSYKLLERHLQRLKESAEYFDFRFSMVDVEQKLSELIQLYPIGVYKVRLLFSTDGEIQLEAEELVKFHDPVIVTLADTAISSNDIFLYHKTTKRQVYDKQRKTGFFDTLLWNERGELTEFTIGNLVLELDGKKVTPPRDSGLLAGTLREELIELGEIKEQVLTKDDLKRATAIWLINSVRGWIRVEAH
jgi:para-aminobenzoate synthetase / 4-amino-4-deoxychorismate lyase